MIFQGKKEITGINYGTLQIIEAYYGKLLVFGITKANSCFGSGYWINDLPWLNDDAWLN